MENSASWLDRLEVLAKYRKFMMRWLLLWIIGGIVAAYVWPPTYRAESSFMPPTEEGGGFFGSLSSSFRLSNVSDVEGGGFNAILTSKRLKDSLDIKFDFRNRYHTKTLDKAYKAFADHYAINTLTEQGIGLSRIFAYYITVTDKSAHDAAEMANAVVYHTDRIATELTSQRQHTTRVFLEGRVNATKESLRVAEDSLRLFSQRTGIVAPEAQVEATITALATVEQQIAEADVGLHISRTTMGTDHPRVKELEARKSELSKQRDEISGKIEKSISSNLIALKQSPELTLEFTRHYRSVRTQEQLLIFLVQQLEQARIGELRDGQVLHVLDTASPPETKRWPVKSLVVILAVSLGLFSALVWIGWREWLLAMQGTPFDERMRNVVRLFAPKTMWKMLIGKE